MIAVSVDGPADLDQMRRASGAEFDFLSDADGRLMDRFGLRHRGGGSDGADIAQSASFLFDSEGRVAWYRVAENYRVRPHPEEVLAAVDRALPR